MLTIENGSVSAKDAKAAIGQAEYLTNEKDSPANFLPGGGGFTGPSLSDGTPSVMWLGSPEALAQLQATLGEAVDSEHLALALQGLSPDGRRLRQAGHGCVHNPEFHFAPDKTDALIWAALERVPAARAAIEHLMIESANQVASYLLQTKDVVWVGKDEDGHHQYVPAAGFVATATLHVTSRTADGEVIPAPQLGVHFRILGAQRADGTLATPQTDALFAGGTAVEGGAMFRSLVAQGMQRLGFSIIAGTGSKGRFSEIEGVSRELVEAASGRTRQIKRERAAIEAHIGRPLTSFEASRLALKNRRSKKEGVSAELVRAGWRAMLLEGGLTLDRVRSLRRQRLRAPLEVRARKARKVILERFRERGPTVSVGEARAIVVEATAGSMSIREAMDLLDELQRNGEVIALDSGLVTTREIRQQEQETIAAVLEAAKRGGVAVSAAALEEGFRLASEVEGFDVSAGSQGAAVRKLCSGVGIGLLHGRAGTGKGPVLRAIAAARRADGCEVIAAAPDGNTRDLMAKQTAGDAYTIARLVLLVESGKLELKPKTVIIIDEAGKVSGDDWAKIVPWLKAFQIELILAGHIGQHDAIMLPGMFAEMYRQSDAKDATSEVLVTVAELEVIRRHDLKWHNALQTLVDKGHGAKAVAMLRKHKAISISDTPEQAIAATVRQWEAARHKYTDPRKTIMVVSGSNTDVDTLNTLAQEERRQNNELGETGIRAVDRDYQLYPGDLVVLRTAPYKFPARGRGIEPEREIANGTMGIVKSVDLERDVIRVDLHEPDGSLRDVEIDLGELRQRMKRGGPRKVPALRLAYAHHTFPIQGATVQDVFYCLITMPSKGGFYVGITRQKGTLHINIHRVNRGAITHDDERLYKRLIRKISMTDTPDVSIRHKPIAVRLAAQLIKTTDYPFKLRARAAEAAAIEQLQARERAGTDEPATILGRLTVVFGRERAERFADAARDAAPDMRKLDAVGLQRAIDHGLTALAELPESTKQWIANIEQRKRLSAKIARSDAEAERFERDAEQLTRYDERYQRNDLRRAAETHRDSAKRHREEVVDIDHEQQSLRRGPGNPAAWLKRHQRNLGLAIAAQQEQQARDEARREALADDRERYAAELPELAV